MKHCSWCDKVFEATVSYQIYCSVECRDSATKEKIAARYIVSRGQKRLGKNRTCKQCGDSLSIYNDESLCNKCLVNPLEVTKALKEIRNKSK